MGSGTVDGLHKVSIVLHGEAIATMALNAFGSRGARSETFLFRLLQQSWDWRGESREAYVKRITEVADAACGQKEALLRGYGGNVTYEFEALYGRETQ